MSDNREEFVRALEETSSMYAEKTTRLSRLISRLELILVKLPGKTEADVVDENGGILRFSRLRDGWGLQFIEHHGGGNTEQFLVNDAPVRVKVIAACLLPKLIESITTHQATQLESVKTGLEAIENIPWLDADSEIELAIQDELRDEVPF